MAVTPSAKLRALLVEDEAIIVMLMEDMLGEIGYEVAATAGRLDKAEHLARQSDFDFAIVDVNLAGEESYPVAEILFDRKIPFLFMSGYGPGGVIPRWSGAQVVSKPISAERLAEAIKLTLSRPEASSPSGS